MKYNLRKIGKRIRKERRAAGYKNQSTLAETLNLSIESRQTIGNWENGKNLPDIEYLLKMCELFDCELGYLLCEYDCKTRQATDIQTATGLSEKAIEMLTKIKQSRINEAITTLSKILEHEDFVDLLRAIHIHIYDFNKDGYRNDVTATENVATLLNCSQNDVKAYMEASSNSRIELSVMKIISDIK